MQLTKISMAIASLGVIGLTMSHQASAAVAAASSGNGSLILVVTDTVTGASFYQDLGQTVSTMLPTNNASFSLNVSGDANYTALTTEAGANALSFAVVGGANGVNAPLGGANDYLTTSGTQTYTATTLTNLNFRNFSLIDQNLTVPLNANTESASKSFYVAPTGSPLYNQASGLWTWNGKTSINTIASVGTTPSNLFFLTGTGSTGHATPTLEGTVTFNAGMFTFTSNNVSAVPLPAAVWLLGSGLAGLVGVGRRRRSAV
jgi:hypothetical protein